MTHNVVASCVLTVVSGPARGGVHELVRGQLTSVGRSEDCAISIDDPSLSRRHFEIRWDGSSCEVADVGSRNGVLINEQHVQRAVARAGDRITAGDSVFLLQIEPAAEPSAPESLSSLSSESAMSSTPSMPAPGPLPVPLFPSVEPTLSASANRGAADSPLLSALASAIAAEPLPLYAVIDGAQAFELAFAARLMGHPLYTLFSGDRAETMASVGPCLVALGEPSGFLERWIERHGKHAGVLFHSGAGVAEVHRHLRHVFVVTDEDGQEFFFRFYDPRVFRTFLPTCRERELREFFGPIAGWIVEADEPASFTKYTLDGSMTIGCSAAL